MATYLTTLYGRLYYFNKLDQLNLVTPSIGLSFPKAPVTTEKLIIHSGLMKVQHLRRNQISKEIERRRRENNRAYDPVIYERLKKKYDKKIDHLKRNSSHQRRILKISNIK